jgi:hypothetical protein
MALPGPQMRWIEQICEPSFKQALRALGITATVQAAWFPPAYFS